MRNIRAIVPLVVLTLLALPAYAKDAPAAGKDAPAAGKDKPPAVHLDVPYTRIGVVLFYNDSHIRDGGAKFTDILLGRLGVRLGGAEFVMADPAVIGVKYGPLQPDEASNLAQHYKVQALVDGIFTGIDIVGGTWPSQATGVPEAKGYARWRLLDAQSGMMVLDGTLDPKKPKLYSTRARDTDELIRFVMRDMAEEIAAALKDAGAAEADAPEGKPRKEPAAPKDNAGGEAK
jgi:hypothetical protein